MGKYQCWSTSRFHPWSFVVFDLHQWSYRRSHYQCKAVCRWYFFVFVAHDSQISANGLNKDLEIINNWAYQWKIRSSYPEVFLGKGVPKICSKFTGEQPCQSAILTNLQNSFIEIILKHGCSPVNFLHTFRTPFPKNASGELFCIFHICWMSTVELFCIFHICWMSTVVVFCF